MSTEVNAQERNSSRDYAPDLGVDFSKRANFLVRLLRHSSARIALIILLLLIGGTVFAPLLTAQSPNDQDYAAVLQSPSLDHVFGTDNLGRDVLSRVLYGGKVSLLVGVLPVAVAFLLGSLIGFVSGYIGGRVDAVVMRMVDIGLAFPGMLLALGIVAVLGPGLQNAMIALAIADFPLAIRVARGAAVSVAAQSFITSAQATGAGPIRIVGRHILPLASLPVVVVATVEVANAILIAAGLSFLGLGAQPPTPEWGSMLAQSKSTIQVAWWTAAFPGIAIVLTVLAINMLGDALSDTLDPRRGGTHGA